MMKSHRRHNTHRIRRALPVIVLAALIAIGVGFSVTRSPLPGVSLATHITTPFASVTAAVSDGAGTFVSVLRSKRDLVRENRELRRTLERRERTDNLIDILQKENRNLKERLGRSPETEALLATVLARPNVSLYDTLLIDIGSADGVAQGDWVHAEGGVAIGTVAQVRERTATVSLFSTPGRETNVLIGAVRTAVIATGRGGGNFAIEVPKEVAVDEGDPVVLPSITPTIMGVVGAVIERSADPFQTVLFTLPVNMQELQYVEVTPAPA